LPEVRRYAPSVPIILVGAKKDLRNNTDMIERLASRGMKPVTTQQGMVRVVIDGKDFLFFLGNRIWRKKKKNLILACFNRQKYFAQAHQKQALAKEIKAAKFVEICHENHHELIELINDGMLVVLSKGGKRLKKDKCNLV
jgi:GTPase SAR1 family protein